MTWLDYVKEGAGYEAQSAPKWCREITYRWYVFTGVIGYPFMVFRFWLCGKFGHKWVDESYGGPESGYMAATCSRCGESYHHRLY